MFTGIIRHVGRVRDAQPASAGVRLTIDLGPLVEGLGAGDSVAVNGLCLTAATIAPPAATFDAMRESLDRSTLGALRVGAKVNLERALPADGRLDGHIVQGHVDGVAKVKAVRTGPQSVLEFAAPRELVDQMVPKGSVTVDGVSLTLTAAAGETFSVALIPTTLADTTLAGLAVGDAVNIEVDILGKYVRRHLQTLAAGVADGRLTLDKLREAGFA